MALHIDPTFRFLTCPRPGMKRVRHPVTNVAYDVSNIFLQHVVETSFEIRRGAVTSASQCMNGYVEIATILNPELPSLARMGLVPRNNRSPSGARRDRTRLLYPYPELPPRDVVQARPTHRSSRSIIEAHQTYFEGSYPPYFARVVEPERTAPFTRVPDEDPTSQSDPSDVDDDEPAPPAPPSPAPVVVQKPAKTTTKSVTKTPVTTKTTRTVKPEASTSKSTRSRTKPISPVSAPSSSSSKPVDTDVTMKDATAEEGEEESDDSDAVIVKAKGKGKRVATKASGTSAKFHDPEMDALLHGEINFDAPADTAPAAKK